MMCSGARCARWSLRPVFSGNRAVTDRLERLGFFKTAAVETNEVAGSDDLIDVDFTVEEQSFGSIGGSWDSPGCGPHTGVEPSAE